jgi:hypothetical protein
MPATVPNIVSSIARTLSSKPESESGCADMFFSRWRNATILESSALSRVCCAFQCILICYFQCFLSALVVSRDIDHLIRRSSDRTNMVFCRHIPGWMVKGIGDMMWDCVPGYSGCDLHASLNMNFDWCVFHRCNQHIHPGTTVRKTARQNEQNASLRDISLVFQRRRSHAILNLDSSGDTPFWMCSMTLLSWSLPPSEEDNSTKDPSWPSVKSMPLNFGLSRRLSLSWTHKSGIQMISSMWLNTPETLK